MQINVVKQMNFGPWGTVYCVSSFKSYTLDL